MITAQEYADRLDSAGLQMRGTLPGRLEAIGIDVDSFVAAGGLQADGDGLNGYHQDWFSPAAASALALGILIGREQSTTAALPETTTTDEGLAL